VIPFAKAHACGNDFLIVGQEEAEGYDKSELSQRLCDRNTGIGADGVEFFAWTGEASGRIQLYNADGSIAEISGNGTRCVAAWMSEERNSQPGDELAIETDAGIRICTLQEFRDSDFGGPTVFVTTDMAVPEFEEQTVELADGTEIDGVFVSMGNPHYVIVLTTSPAGADESESDFFINDRSWQDIGEEICFHPDFPDQTNVEFVRVTSSPTGKRDRVSMRIFERGVGPTSSSGTGTSATATAMIGVYGGVSPMEVATPGGIQTVEWAGPGEPLYLTGPATLIARGEAW
jgi:diaminopimelate epimerase